MARCFSNLKRFSTSLKRCQEKVSSIAPPVSIDTKSIRLNPEFFSRNCRLRKYQGLAEHPFQIARAHNEWLVCDNASLKARKQLKATQAQLPGANSEERRGLLRKAKELSDLLTESDEKQEQYQEEVERLSIQLPNLTSDQTPLSDEPEILELHEPPSSHDDETQRDHVRIGTEFGLIDFAAAATTSGWGFYFLQKEAVHLAHALVQYALSVAREHGFEDCEPPSLIYSEIGSACGFRPRDQHGEEQVYALQQNPGDVKRRKPSLSLSGTAEIPFAGMKANRVMDPAELPHRVLGSSRCFRAEAGARGRETRGLYRVHEFTKVEMFAWTMPNKETQLFDDMIAVQKQIIESLDLPYRRLEMPACDLGASAYRKQDIEVFFPSRKELNGGWGEVTSTSICTDYQTRRLNTRVKVSQGSDKKLAFPCTVNGTAMAVPRILAAILENGWSSWNDEEIVNIPKVLWPWMGGQKVISKK